jgi:hypothetical protein
MILSPSPDRIDDETLRLIALAIHLEVNCNELEPSYHDARIIEWGNEEWLVLTDDEADERSRENAENYFDDYVDGCMDEGRGMQLALYDGVEHEIYIKATNEWLYLYRIN